VQKERATYSLDGSLLRATRIAAARQGKRESEIVEDALRSYLAFGLLEEIWAKNTGDLDGDEALALAVAEQHAARRGE
jgi:metal-responsive CopG/Arc/MetJ family transcriptional regulator